MNQLFKFKTSTWLILSINLPLLGLTVGLLAWDYHREVERITAQLTKKLDGDATLIGTAVSKLADGQCRVKVANFVADQCVETNGNGALSSSRVVNVSWNGSLLHGHTLPAMGDSKSKPSHVVGKYDGGDVYVEVAEPIADVRHLARQEAFIHALFWLSLAVVAVALIDCALLQTVFKPVNHLSSIVRSLRERDFDVDVGSVRSSELGELGNEIRSMAHQLRVEDRHHTVAMKRATSIQQHLLPRQAMLPGLDVATHYCPAVDVAGDIFDFQELADGNWLLYVADVVGHGVPAALSAAILKMLVESSVAEIVSEPDDMPARVLERINCRFDRYFSSSELITMVILLWCPRTQRMHMASAGHEPVWFMANGCVHELESTGIPLGVSGDAKWQTRSVELATDDLVLLSTDGLAECMSDQGELFGRKRVRATLSSIQQRVAQQVVNDLVSSLEEFRANNPPSDDVTLIVLQLTG